jgi:hypothetical protein
MILYYSNAKVTEQIKRNREGIWQYMANDRKRIHTFKDYENFGLLKYNMVYDRTKQLPHFLNITADAHPMPGKVEKYNRSFWDVTEQRARELLSLDKPINVMWSGGIDSTYILYVLQHYANDPDQIRVYGTYNSIIESGDVFDRHIKNNFRHYIKVASPNTENFKDIKDGIFVSGMCGNQLFGPTDNMFAQGGKGMFHHTLGTPETIYKPYEKHINPDLLDFFWPMIKASPRKIETVADLRWYCIFNLDWYTAIYEHRIQIEKQYAENIYGFFDSIPFQEWAINTKEPFTKIKGNPLTHRWQMRDVLKEFGLSHYATHKDKKISNFAFLDSNWMLLLDGYQNIYDYHR